MKKKLDLNAIMAVIHLVVILSLVCFGTIYLTFGILAIPALTAAFAIGKDVVFKRFDVHDALVKRFFKLLRSELGMMRYFPAQLIIILQTAGIYAAQVVGMDYLIYPMTVIIAFSAAFIVYIIAYHTFYSPKPSVIDVAVAMFYRVQYLLIIWILMVMFSLFFGTSLMGIFMFAGAVPLIAVEAVAFLDIAAYKRLRKELTDEEIEIFGEALLSKI